MLIAYLPQLIGNRLRSLAAASAISSELNTPLVINWLQTSAFDLSYEDVFEVDFKTASTEEVMLIGLENGLDLYTEIQNWHGWKQESQNGRHLLAWLAMFCTPNQVSELEPTSTNKNLLLYTNDFHYKFSLDKQLIALRELKLAHNIKSRVYALLNDLHIRDLPSVHARGSDFTLFLNAKTDWFDYYREMILERIPHDSDFFLTTEDFALKERLLEEFSSRVRIRAWSSYEAEPSKTPLTPNSTTTADSLVDLYLLSCTNLVVFHPQSSYAQLARVLKGTI